MSSRSTQANRLGRELSDAMCVEVEVRHQAAAIWLVEWADGPTVDQMRQQVTQVVAGPQYPALADRRLDYSRGTGSRAWAARAVAARRDGTLAGEIAAGVAYRRSHPIPKPAWSDMTDEEVIVVQFVERLIEQTPYPDRASHPADGPLIEQLRTQGDHTEHAMARILLDADQLGQLELAPTRAEWNARLAAHQQGRHR